MARKLLATRPLPKSWVEPAYGSKPAHDCPECGCYVYADSFCTYCYDLADYHFVKAGNAVLYRGFDQDAAEQAWSDAYDRAWQQKKPHPRHTIVPNVLRTNPNPDSEQG